MIAWQQWKERARSAKERSGKSDADLAEIISELSSRKAGRAQVNHWFTGKREPTLSQFMLLCEELAADPCEILFGHPDPNFKPAPIIYRRSTSKVNRAAVHDAPKTQAKTRT